MRNMTFTISVLFLLVVSQSVAETPFYARFDIMQGNARVGEEFTLALTIKSLIDIPDLRVVFEIPDGIEILSGTLSKALNLSSRDSTELPMRLSITQRGPYKITAHIIIAPKDTIYFLQRLVKEFYIISDSINATYSENPVEGVYYNLLSEQVIGEIPPEPPSPLTSYTLSGTVRYRNKLTNQLDPLAGILIKLIDRITGNVIATVHTNSSGNYSITTNPGKYTLIIFAQNYAGEVHRFWEGVARWYGDCDLYCSRDAYQFISQAVNLYGNITVDYNAEEDKADWARILWRIQRDKDWMYNHTSPHRTLEYIEICYPASGTIIINRVWPWPDTTITYEAPRTPFYVYWGKLEAVKFKIERFMPSWWPWDWWGLGVQYRNPHQVIIEKYNDIWHPRYAIGGLSHEWCHGLMVSTLGNKVPYDWGHAIHDFDTVLTQGHAFSEGFAEFCAPAMWIEEMGQNVYPYSSTLERFYANNNHPYYQGPGSNNYTNADGRFVEGSVMQFLWDLFDDRNTNDHEQNFDDDEVYGGIAKIMNTLASLGTIMTAETSVWDTLGNEEGDSIAFKSKKAHFPGPNYDFIGKFKSQWESAGYGNITELFYVDIHPFNYLQPYPVPAPTNLYLIGVDHAQKRVRLAWTNNAFNQGAFYVARNVDNSGYVTAYAKISNRDQTWFYDYIQEGHSYKYKVRAMTCDTSGYSNEVTIPWYVAAPTMQPVVDVPPNQARVSWQNNSNLIIVSYTVSRWDDVTNQWNDSYKTGLTNTYFIDDVQFLHKYKYRVKAQESGGHWSAWSNVVEYTCGVLAQSNYPKMSAFNSNYKIVRGYDGKIHIIYYDGIYVRYSFSTDNGTTFSPWETVCPSDTIPAIALDNSGTPWIINATHYWPNQNTCALEYYLYHRTSQGGWQISYDEVYRKTLTGSYPNVPALLHPPSFVSGGDSGYVSFIEPKESNCLVSSFLLATSFYYNLKCLGTNSVIYLPVIGYDKAGRLVVIDITGDGMKLYYRSIGSAQWHTYIVSGISVWGSPALWVGTNEVRIAYGGEGNNNLFGVLFKRMPWTGTSYDLSKPLEMVGANFDISPDWSEGYTYLAGPDVVLWKYQDDIWYAQRQSGAWLTLGNLSQSGGVSSYPQGLVFGSFLRQKLFALWTGIGDKQILPPRPRSVEFVASDFSRTKRFVHLIRHEIWRMDATKVN